MTLRVIGAGFGRTGTESMKRALELLGYGPCHHMYEVLPNAQHYAEWQRIYDGAEPPDWDHIYSGYSAAIDWPTAYYWREVTDHFPDAKVILTTRSPESWYDSFSRTILPAMRSSPAPKTRFTYHMLAVSTFGNRFDDPDHCIAVFEAQNAAVRASIAPERLLEYELGSGWEPLCAFLGCPIPDDPYPRGNASEEFHTRLDEAERTRAEQLARTESD